MHVQSFLDVDLPEPPGSSFGLRVLSGGRLKSPSSVGSCKLLSFAVNKAPIGVCILGAVCGAILLGCPQENTKLRRHRCTATVVCHFRIRLGLPTSSGSSGSSSVWWQQWDSAGAQDALAHTVLDERGACAICPRYFSRGCSLLTDILPRMRRDRVFCLV